MAKKPLNDATTNSRYRHAARMLLIDFLGEQGIPRKEMLKCMDTNATRIIDAIEDWAIHHLGDPE